MKGFNQNTHAISNESLKPKQTYSRVGGFFETNKVKILNISYRIALCVFDFSMDEFNTQIPQFMKLYLRVKFNGSLHGENANTLV